VSDNKLLEKLQKLYRLALLNENEAEDPTRQNEARTAAFLLLKTARENGVKIKFEVPRQANAPRRPTTIEGVRVDPGDIFEGFMKDVVEEAARRRAAGEGPFGSPFRPPPARGRRPPSQGWSGSPPVDDFSGGVAQPRKSHFSRSDCVIVEVRVNGNRDCAVCGEVIQSGLMAWMLQGFGFAHRGLNYVGHTCKCDEGLQQKWEEEKLRKKTDYVRDKQYGQGEGPFGNEFPTEPTLITAKQGGFCNECDIGFAVGDDVWWLGGIGFTHESCGNGSLRQSRADREARSGVKHDWEEVKRGRKRSNP
jgi:hypothetical protein